MLADNRRKTEVSIRDMTPEERKLMEDANGKEVDQWITKSVFKIVRRAGIPIKRIMAMRWILTWKEAPEGTQAKARLVAHMIHRPIFIDHQSRGSYIEQNWKTLSTPNCLFPHNQAGSRRRFNSIPSRI